MIAVDVRNLMKRSLRPLPCVLRSSLWFIEALYFWEVALSRILRIGIVYGGTITTQSALRWKQLALWMRFLA